MGKKIAISLAVASVLSTSGVWGLGLGDIQSQSALNQPLNAEIHLLSADSIENSQLKASIASYETYEKQGLARSGLHNQIRFVTVTKPNGEKVIRLSTREPLKEPFLNFLVEVEWPQGRLLREYTLLLDPPTYAAKSAPVLTPAQTGSRQPATVASRPAVNEPVARPTLTTSGDSYTIRRNDTLWSIASQVRPDSSVSVQQTLAAIYRANPHAFIDNDINRIETGESLKIPTLQEIQAVPARAALRDVARSSAAASGPALDARQDRPAARPAGSASRAGGRLSLAGVPDAEGENSGSGAGGDARSEQAMNLEATETLRRENRELRNRLETLNERLDTLERLLTLQDPELAAMTAEADKSQLEEIADSRAGDRTADEADSMVAEADLETTTGNGDATASTPEQATAGEQSLADATGPEEEATGPEETVSEQPAASSLPPESVAPIGRRAKEPGFFETGNIWLWTALGGLLALILAAVWWFRRRGDDQDHDFAMAAEDKMTLPAIGGDDLLTDLEDDDRPMVAAPKISDAAEVDESTDLTAEAEVLMERERYSEAQALWKIVVANHPDDWQSQLQLLRCYAATGASADFEALASDLQMQAGSNPLVAEEIASLRATVDHEAETGDSMGSEGALILPSEDEIFGNDAEDAKTGESAEADFDLPVAGDDEQPVVEDDDELVSAEEDNDDEVYLLDDELEFDLDDKPRTEDALAAELEDDSGSEETALPEADEGLEFSLDGLQDDKDEIVDAPEQDHENIIEFESSVTDDTGLADDDFDEDLLAGEGDQAATKLDLARAYVDMGDEEAARDILNEVVLEGTQAQQTEAADLLERLG